MSNYPDNFRGTPYDAERCAQCGRGEYTNDAGLCADCERHEQRALKEELSSAAAYGRIIMDLGNKVLAKQWGWI